MKNYTLYLLFSVFAFIATNVHAEDDTRKIKASELLHEGDLALSKGDQLMAKDEVELAIENYEKALTSYQAAYQTFASPKIYFPIALTEQKLGRFQEALKHYELLLDSEIELSNDVTTQVHEGIELTKDNLVGFLPEIHPNGATIFLDNKNIGVSPLDKIVYVTPGLHEIRIKKNGYATYKAEFDKDRGDIEKSDIRLKEKTQPESPEEDDIARGPSKLPLWIGLGSAVFLAGTATYTGLRAREDNTIFKDPMSSQQQKDNTKKSGKRLALITDGLFAGAAIAGAFTLYYYWFKVRPSSKTDTVVWSPYIDSNSSGWFVKGQF